jgi:hypothetical protein
VPPSAGAAQSGSVAEFLCALAQEHRQAGRLEEAAHELRKVLLLAPAHACALEQLRELSDAAPPQPVAMAAPPRLTAVAWWSMAGRQRRAGAGEMLPGPQRFFVLLPPSAAEPLCVRILDADTTGGHDEIDGIPDTFTSFRLYGAGPRALDATIIGPEHPDGTLDDVALGPVAPDAGEHQGDAVVFRLDVEGLRGDDLNGFAFDLHPSAR